MLERVEDGSSNHSELRTLYVRGFGGWQERKWPVLHIMGNCSNRYNLISSVE